MNRGTLCDSKWIATATVCLCVLAAGIACAAERTWIGGGADDNWSTAGNWDSGTPLNGDSLTFTGNVQQANYNDVSGLVLGSMSFAEGGFFLDGSEIGLTAVTNATGDNECSLPLSFGAGAHAQALGGTLTLDGVINNNGNDIAVDGPGATIIMLSDGSTTDGRLNGAGMLIKTGTGRLTFSGGYQNYGAGNNFGGVEIREGSVVEDTGTYGESRMGSMLTVWTGGSITCLWAHPLGNGAVPVNLYGGLYRQEAEGYIGEITMTGGVFSAAGNVANGGTAVHVCPAATPAVIVAEGGFDARTYTVEDGAADPDLVINSSGSTHGSITKEGAGRIEYNGTNLSGLAVNGGMFAFGAAADFLEGAIVNVGTGSVLDVSALPSPYVLDRNITLGGSGVLLGPVISQANGWIKPGGNHQVGTLTFSNALTLSGTRMTFDLNATNTTTGSGINDLVVVAGALDLEGVTTITPMFLPVRTNLTYTIIRYNSLLSGDASNLQPGGPNTAEFTVSGGEVRVTFTPLPGSGGTCMWAAAYGNLWDTLTPNWMVDGSPSYYIDGDDVRFEDGAADYSVSMYGPPELMPKSVVVDAAATYTISDTDSGTLGTNGYRMNLTKDGSGRLIIDANFQYAGTTMVNNGVLQLHRGNWASGSDIGSSVLVINPGATVDVAATHVFNDTALNPIKIYGGTLMFNDNGGCYIYPTLEFRGGSLVIGPSGGDPRVGTTFTCNVHTSDTVAVLQDMHSMYGGVFTFSVENGAAEPDIIVKGMLSGATALNKTGVGTLALDGTNGASGATIVLGGKYFVNGYSAANANLTSKGVLGGMGTINGPVVIWSGGMLAPGTNSIGTLTINSNLIMRAGSMIEWNVGSGISDVAAIGGVLVLTNPPIATTVSVVAVDVVNPGDVNLLCTFASMNGNTNSLFLGGPNAAGAYFIVDANSISISGVTGVPEPALAGLTTLCILGFRVWSIRFAPQGAGTMWHRPRGGDAASPR